MQSAYRLTRKYWAELLLILSSSAAYLYKLGSYRFFDGDEMIYHQVAHNINKTGDWLTLYWRFNPDGSLVQWFEKPPLILWLKALLIRLPGQIEFWSRLPSALAGIGTVYLTYLIGKKLFNKSVGLMAAFMILTAPGLVRLFRIGRLDGPLVFFIWLAFYFSLRVKDDHKYYYWFGVATGLAAMTKGATAVLIPAIVGLAWWWNGELKPRVVNRHLLSAAIIAAAITAPWHLAELLRHGQAFWDEYFGFHVWTRIKESVIVPMQAQSTILLERRRNRTFYFFHFYRQFFPWVFLVPFGWASALLLSLRGKKEYRLLLTSTVLVFLAFSIISTKLIHYIAPAYPALAIMAAVTIVDAWHFRRLVPVLGVWFAGLMALYLSPYNFTSTTSITALGLVTLAALAILTSKFKLERATIAISVGVLAVTSLYPFTGGFQMYNAAYVRNSQQVAELTIDAKPNAPVIVYPLDLSTLSSFVVLTYADQPVIEAEVLGRIDEVTTKGESRLAIVTTEGIDLLKPRFQIVQISSIGDFHYVKLTRVR